MKQTQILIILFIAQLSFSQIDYGIQGGLNFNRAGSIQLTGEQFVKNVDLGKKTGYHFGLYAKVDFLIFYLRPELQYTRVSSMYDGNTIDNSRIELPLSLGITAIGPLSIFIGPTAYFNLSQKSAELDFANLENKTNLGLHFGTRLQLGALGIDLRYEKGLSDEEVQIVSQAGIPLQGQVNSRPNQFVLGISLKLN
ncbi:MAG: hypothetical protein CMC93_07710 [Flavobacteriaceae bacterium]|nr:hypothetical protein [Flavobacteriaceae bacterium]